MSVGSRVRKIYERRPYPPPSLRGTVARASLPAMEWVNTIAEKRPGKTPGRILIAGCGAGTEAFALARTYPSAEVLGVDFSARSIEIAGCESITAYPPVKVSHLDAGYLAGDIFGPLNRSLPLSEWASHCTEAGLHFFGSHRTFFAVKDLLNRDLHSLLMPRTRAEVALLVDALQPTSFHHMVLSRRKPAQWDNGALSARRLSLTPLYTAKIPRRSRDCNALRDVVLESAPMATRVTLSIPQWEVEILRNCDGVRTIRELLASVKPAVPAKALREAMYLVYILGVVNFSE